MPYCRRQISCSTSPTRSLHGSWRVLLDRAHRPGQFKRWYLRALQEDFDARLRPPGWSEPGFAEDAAWTAPQVLEVPADRPAAAGRHYDYLTDGGVEASGAVVRAREVPLVRETFVTVGRLARSGRVRWLRDPRDWFEYRIPGSFEVVDQTAAAASGAGAWQLQPAAGEGAFATFELPEQMVGFPFLTVVAPAGTVAELMTQESHDPAGPAWLDTHRFSWTRFVCREGENRLETFDYESLRFLQVHVREASGPVVLRDVGVRRRSYPWPKAPSFACAEPKLQRVFEASFNTLVNAAQETIDARILIKHSFWRLRVIGNTPISGIERALSCARAVPPAVRGRADPAGRCRRDAADPGQVSGAPSPPVSGWSTAYGK